MNATPATTKTDAATEPTTDAETEGASTTEAASSTGGATAETAPAATDAPDTDAPDAGGPEHLHDDEDALDGELDAPAATRPGFGAGAAAVVAAALGAVSLSGTWMGKTLSERATLVGQIKTSQSGTAAQQIQEIYGNSWHTTALVNGVFALLALIVGAAVLARPAFGTPGRAEQPVWVKAVALAGVVLGVVGLLISAGMYLDLFAALPSAKG
ncbi:hypothetical protein [Streptomyces sp. NBC_00083]|uniref:hypothetical protein n=1 Tax=Streptomyces sp. NBC_00083 TaxID=2975647 RepID=UPI00224D0F80|nr:hypothetical protein [Streptomyces sp. NBC_00083]MCX5385845.1 hypothetical protein [Streptomyces sp. NBC_00083]